MNPSTTRLDIHRQARRRALELRERALADAFAWLRRQLLPQRAKAPKEQTCHS